MGRFKQKIAVNIPKEWWILTMYKLDIHYGRWRHYDVTYSHL